MKMRGNPELVVSKNICFLSAVLILISSFIGCAAGSCLSYGHSCWGAHGKRSRPSASLSQATSSSSSNIGSRRVAMAPPIPDDPWLLSRLLGRQQLVQSPAVADRIAARLRAEEEQPQQLVLAQTLDDELGLSPLFKRSLAAEKLSRIMEVRGIPKSEQRMTERESSDILFNTQLKDFANDDDQAIKMRLYKILKNIEEKSK